MTAMINQEALAKAIKPLVWSEVSAPNAYCGYTHTFADTSLGRYQIEWKSWKDYPGFSTELIGGGFFSSDASDLADAKKIAAAHLQECILSAFNIEALPHVDRAGVLEPSAMRGLFSDIAQMLDTIKQEWSKQGAWSEWDQGVRDRITATLSGLYALAQPAVNTPPEGVSGWQPIETAPKDRTSILAAVPTKELDGFHVGEAYFDPETGEDGDWWWAGTGWGDYHASPISEANFHQPTHWQPLPASPPQPMKGASR